jgi:ABC-type proline/glycine betaine transport system ATPase subunit
VGIQHDISFISVFSSEVVAAIQIFSAGEDKGEIPESYSNKSGNVGINLTLRRVRVTIVAMENQ